MNVWNLWEMLSYSFGPHEKLFSLEPALSEGQMTTLRAQLVCEEALAAYKSTAGVVALSSLRCWRREKQEEDIEIPFWQICLKLF